MAMAVPVKYHGCTNMIMVIISKTIKLLYELIALVVLVSKLLVWFTGRVLICTFAPLIFSMIVNRFLNRAVHKMSE